MFGQSVGGGGGFAMLTGQLFDETTGRAYSDTGTLDEHVALALTNPGGATDGGSNGGQVTANLRSTGHIATSGTNSYGIIGQSIGGGGGIFVADINNSTNASDLYSALENKKVWQNDGGTVHVNTEAGSSITTSGKGAAGIVAQAIGGGGASVNGLNGVDMMNLWGLEYGVPSRGESDRNWNAGNAGSVVAEVNGDITTTGAYAHGIFAQAAANGGGMIGRDNGWGYLFFGNVSDRNNGHAACKGPLCNGHISVTIGDGTSSPTITVSGEHAYGFAGTSVFESPGGNAVHLIVNENASIIAKGQAAGAVLIAAGQEGIVDNSGLIDASASQNKVAIQGWSGIKDSYGETYEFPYTVNNSGTIRGSVKGGGSTTGNSPLVTLNNMAGGMLEAGEVLDLGGGTLTNAGTLHVGTVGAVAMTGLTGDLVQQEGGTLHVDVDFRNAVADHLSVSGEARLAGTISVGAQSVSNRSWKVLTASDGITLDPALRQTDGSALFDFPVAVSGNDLLVAPEARFGDAAAGLGRNREAVAGHLQGLWDGGTAFDDGFTALAGVAEGNVGGTLDALSGQALGLIGASRYQSSLGFVDTIWQGCDATLAGRCAWGRWVGARGTMDATGNAQGYQTRTNGFHIGYGTALSDVSSVGVAIGYENISAHDRDGIGSIDGDSVQLGAYGTWESGAWRLGAAADLGYGWFDTTRTITLGGLSDVATGSTNGWQAGLHGRAAWHQDFAQGWIEPRFDLSLLHVRTDGFSETGPSPFNLAVDGTSDTTLVATPALAAGTEFELRNGARLKLSGSIGYTLMSDDAWSPAAHLAGGAEGFTAATPLPDRLWKIGLGAELVTVGNVTLSAAYNGSFGSGYDSHAAELRLDYRF